MSQLVFVVIAVKDTKLYSNDDVDDADMLAVAVVDSLESATGEWTYTEHSLKNSRAAGSVSCRLCLFATIIIIIIISK